MTRMPALSNDPAVMSHHTDPDRRVEERHVWLHAMSGSAGWFGSNPGRGRGGRYGGGGGNGAGAVGGTEVPGVGGDRRTGKATQRPGSASCLVSSPGDRLVRTRRRARGRAVEAGSGIGTGVLGSRARCGDWPGN